RRLRQRVRRGRRWDDRRRHRCAHDAVCPCAARHHPDRAVRPHPAGADVPPRGPLRYHPRGARVMLRSQQRALMLLASVAVVALLMVFFGWIFPTRYSATDTRLVAQAFYIGLAAMGLNILTGYNGQVSIGHGAFFGVGAYTTALLMHHEYTWFGITFGHVSF